MNFGLLLHRAARRFAPRVAAIDAATGAQLTFRELDSRSTRLANALLSFNPTQGERVALLLENQLEFIEADFAIAKAGKVKVPIHPKLAPAEQGYILAQAGAGTLIFDSQFAPVVEQMRHELPALRNVIQIGERNIEAEDYETLIKSGADRLAAVESSSEDPSLILYTSGTTGRPKGATTSYRSRLAATMNMWIDELDVRTDDVMLHVAPLSHGSGSKLLAYYLKGACHMLARRFDPEYFLRLVAQQQVTNSFMVPTMMGMLLDTSSSLQREVKSLRSITYGGAPISVDKLRRAVEIFGPVFVQIYGSCEAPHPVTVLSQEEHRAPSSDGVLSSIGHEVTGVDVRIVVQSDGRDADPGETGELWISGENVMTGYWDDPEATRDVMSAGWYRSGDLGWRDEAGYIYITDRSRDMIISGGLNIYAAEVEAALERHPGVKEAAVIGLPDEKWGEAVKAFVVVRAGSHVTHDDLIEHCLQQLASYKKPRHIEFVERLPRGATGKLQKRDLRAAHWTGMGRQVN